MLAVVSGKKKSLGAVISSEAEKLGYDVILHENEKEPLNYDELGCDVLVQLDMFSYNNPSDFRNLKFVQALMVGTDKQPIAKLKEMGVKYASMKGVFDKPIAEFVLMRILDIYKHMRTYEKEQKEHSWKKRFDLLELTDKKIAVIGTGHIGSEIAKRIKAFDAYCYGFSKSGNKAPYFDDVYKADKLKEKIGLYDIVVAAMPLTDDTYHLFDEDMFNLMKDNSAYINIARGGVQSEEALYNALTNGKLMAAAVDVFEKEPLDAQSPLWDLENFFYSPHNSFSGDKNDEMTAKVVLDNLKAYIEGKEPENIV